jgi:NADH dehydrogenase [ubiquinone] 1 alpha subcomplex assembly factor 3
MSMDDDGDLARYRTTVSVLNQEQDRGIFIDSYSCLGFLLSTGIRVIGPCAVFPRSVLHWNVRSILNVTEESLSLFTMLEPKIDILVLGVGERENLKKVDSKVIKYLREKKINIEVLATDQALATFNFLNAEKRYVAGAFIPPSYVNAYEDEDITLHGPLPGPDRGQEDDDLKPVYEKAQLVKEQMDKERGNKGKF